MSQPLTHFSFGESGGGRRSILSPMKMSVFTHAAGCEECVFHLCCLSVYIYIVPLTVLGLHILKGKRVNV